MGTVKTSRQTIGIVLVVISAIVFSSAGIFTRGVSTDAWDIIFWRGSAASVFTILYLVLRGDLFEEIKAFGKPAFAASMMMAAGTAAFIPAFKLSSVANVALIYAAAPFIAAGLSWIFIKETPTTKIILASVAALLGVLVIVSQSLGGSQIKGDMLALFMTLMMAGMMVVYRKFPSTTAALPAAFSSIVLLPVAFMIGTPFDVEIRELPTLVAFGLVFAIASVTLSEGARRLPSAETALLSTLEMPLAPVLAFLILSEVPLGSTVVGGAIIFLAVIWSQTPRT